MEFARLLFRLDSLKRRVVKSPAVHAQSALAPRKKGVYARQGEHRAEKRLLVCLESEAVLADRSPVAFALDVRTK